MNEFILWAVSAVMLFLLVFGATMGILRYKEMKTKLSALSIKNAMDSLRTGVMFCEEDGFILLVNTQMQRIMTVLTGKPHRNGRHFYGRLTLGEIEPGCEISWFEGENVCVLPDGSAWKFSITELFIGRKKYYQMAASDITLLWKLTLELTPKRDELMRRQKEISEVITNLHILSHKQESQNAKMRAHDILGERLTLLTRAIRSGQAPDFAMLRSLSHDLIGDLKTIKRSPSPQDELDTLRRIFNMVGVAILLEGKMPENVGIGRLIADIIREAVTNAVRHGFATKVYIQIEDGEKFLRLIVTDDGHPPLAPISEGGGIGGMRKKVGTLGGTVTVSESPQFTLTIEI